MREIKFRAWDEDEEEMYYSNKPYDEHFFEFSGRKLLLFAIRPPRASHNPYEPPEPYCDEYGSIMQFTGLHDKNGKKIWEGDIVKFTYLHDEREEPETMKAKVGWWEWRQGWAVIYDENNHDKFNDLADIEVIGNIWENPELLEDK